MSTLTAVTAVPTPIVASCTLDIGILGVITKVTMIWSFAVPTDYTVASNTQFYSSITPIPAGATVSPLATPPATSQPVPNGPYHSVFDGSLLNGILGGNLYLYVQAKAGTWVSARAGVRVTYGVIGIGTTCNKL